MLELEFRKFYNWSTVQNRIFICQISNKLPTKQQQQYIQYCTADVKKIKYNKSLESLIWGSLVINRAQLELQIGSWCLLIIDYLLRELNFENKQTRSC